MLNIESPTLEAVEMRLKDAKGKAPTALSNAINRAIANVKTNMVKTAASRYMVHSQKPIKASITVHKSTRNTLSAEAISRASEKIKLYDFKVNPTKGKPKKPPQFYKSQVLKDGGLKEMSGSQDRSKAFVAQMASGHIGIFERQLNAQRSSPRSGRKHDQPIVELSGLSVPAMIGEKNNLKTIQEEGEKTLRERLDHEIERMLGATAK